MKERVPTLKVTLRERTGSRYAQRARTAGHLPGVIYGHKADPVSVNFTGIDTILHIKAGEKVFKLDFPQGAASGEQMVLLKEVQFDYLGDSIIHADFARVDMNERVRTKVHVMLVGDARGLKNAGAILIHPTNELEIECRVADLPDSVQVDVSELDMNESISADKVKLPSADMRLITDPHAIVAQIVEQKEEVVAEAVTVATDAVQPEVIGEKERLEKLAAEGAKPGAAPGKDAKAGAAAAKGGAAAPKGGAAAPKAGAAPAKGAKPAPTK